MLKGLNTRFSLSVFIFLVYGCELKYVIPVWETHNPLRSHLRGAVWEGSSHQSLLFLEYKAVWVPWCSSILGLTCITWCSFSPEHPRHPQNPDMFWVLGCNMCPRSGGWCSCIAMFLLICHIRLLEKCVSGGLFSKNTTHTGTPANQYPAPLVSKRDSVHVCV